MFKSMVHKCANLCHPSTLRTISYANPPFNLIPLKNSTVEFYQIYTWEYVTLILIKVYI